MINNGIVVLLLADIGLDNLFKIGDDEQGDDVDGPIHDDDAIDVVVGICCCCCCC